MRVVLWATRIFVSYLDSNHILFLKRYGLSRLALKFADKIKQRLPRRTEQTDKALKRYLYWLFLLF